MKAELKAALEQRGWDEVYERYIPSLSSPNQRGERRAVSPFPDSTDVNPSFQVNIFNGLWRCFSSGRSGNFVQFYALMTAVNFDQNGQAIPDYPKAERELLIDLGVALPIDNSKVLEFQNALYNDQLILSQIVNFKPWTREGLWALQVGFSYQHNRFVIPFFDQHHQLLNARLYRPGGDPKMLWLVPNLTGNFLFPHQAWRENILILTEGEPDVISLRTFGFHACCGTMGANLPVPDGPWFHGKTIFLWFDVDRPGQEAVERAVYLLQGQVAALYVVQLPTWPGRPEKADPSDYIQHLVSCGYGTEQIVRLISEVLQSAQLVNSAQQSQYDVEPIITSFSRVLTSEHVSERAQFFARAVAKSSTRYMVPTEYELRCPARGHSYCKRCPMSYQFNGQRQLTHDPRSPETLKLVQVSEERRNSILLKMAAVPPECPDVQLTIANGTDIEPMIIGVSPTEAEDLNVPVDHQRREAFILVNSNSPPVENTDYTFCGFTYAHPKSQQLVLLMEAYEESQALLGTNNIDYSLIEVARSLFSPVGGETAYQKLTKVAEDLAGGVTQIYDRLDLHLAYRTVWHSLVSFDFQDEVYRRGWIEALIIGDTRCGKSSAFKKMSEFYGKGVLVDCKLQTPAGILGAVINSSSGEYYAVPGLMPQNDGGILCFDEFHVQRFSGASLMDHLSSTRAEGVVRISKAAQASFPARVRSVWLANPGGGSLLKDLGDSGVETAPKLIQQPEDIARFDFAMTVSQEDVASQTINTVREKQEPRYSQKVSRELLRWAYTRQAHQVIWEKEAMDWVMQLALNQCEKYDASIPFVEPADQRHRVAKVCVSVAVQCASISDDLQSVVVKPEHVMAAAELFELWYTKPSMGYDLYSLKYRMEEASFDESVPLNLFTNVFSRYSKKVAFELLRLDQFSEKGFGLLAPHASSQTRSTLQLLSLAGCIRLVRRGNTEFFEKTPAFVRFLKSYLGLSTPGLQNMVKSEEVTENAMG